MIPDNVPCCANCKYYQFVGKNGMGYCEKHDEDAAMFGLCFAIERRGREVDEK